MRNIFAPSSGTGRIRFPIDTSSVFHNLQGAPTAEIEAILLDAVGTLIAPAESVGTTYARHAQESGLPELDPSELDRAFREEFRGMPPMTGRGEDWWRELVDRTFARVGAVFPRPAFLSLYDFYATESAWRVYPEVPEVLEGLKKSGFRLAVASNFDARLHAVLEALDLRKDLHEVFTSSELGAAKPDRMFFQLVTSTLQISPTRCLHVGDDPRADWQGARESGLAVVELDRKTSDLTTLLHLLNP